MPSCPDSSPCRAAPRCLCPPQSTSGSCRPSVDTMGLWKYNATSVPLRRLPSSCPCLSRSSHSSLCPHFPPLSSTDRSHSSRSQSCFIRRTPTLPAEDARIAHIALANVKPRKARRSTPFPHRLRRLSRFSHTAVISVIIAIIAIIFDTISFVYRVTDHLVDISRH